MASARGRGERPGLLRHGRARPGHPRSCFHHRRTWMPGTSPGMTVSVSPKFPRRTLRHPRRIP
ncbi:hypothetical protein XH96_04130 [Bradyrhizobium sp. CCBAU 51765]|nr:hypothetical protein XH96_04130 [Bradyrhizobium sp. CCBAU 51765]